MQKIELEAKIRENTGTSRSRVARLAGLVPAIVCGKGVQSIPLEIDSKKFMKILSSKAGRNVIITLNITGNDKKQSIPVLTHEVQTDPISDNIIHVDFYKIKMEEEIRTKVPVILMGEPIGVKLDEGILVHGLREIEIKCLPTNIPDKFEADISKLKIGNNLHVSDLKVEKGVTLVTQASEIIATVAAPAKEEVEAAPITAPEVTGQAVPIAEGAAAPGAPAGKEAAPAKGAPATAAKGAAAPAAAPAKGGAAPAKAPAPEAKKK